MERKLDFKDKLASYGAGALLAINALMFPEVSQQANSRLLLICAAENEQMDYSFIDSRTAFVYGDLFPFDGELLVVIGNRSNEALAKYRMRVGTAADLAGSTGTITDEDRAAGLVIRAPEGQVYTPGARVIPDNLLNTNQYTASNCFH